MSSFILFGILLIASHAFTAYIAYHEGYLKGYFDRKKQDHASYWGAKITPSEELINYYEKPSK